MKIKVALIIERANIGLGGAERSLFELASALNVHGLDVTILAAKGHTQAKHVHVLCKDSTAKRVSYRSFETALHEHFAKNKYDIIHSFLPFSCADIYQPRGGSYAETIVRNAASYENKFLACLKRVTAFVNIGRAERNLCKDPNGPIVAALSQYVADQFKSHYNLPDDRIVVIPNGVKLHEHIDTARARKLYAQILVSLSLKEADQPAIFLFVAHNFRLKGLSPLIRAMSLLKSRKLPRQPILVVTGRGRPTKYRRLAKLYGVADRIIFLGKLSGIQNALSITDAAVLPTFYDPASRFILEALASSKPVITTAFNGATDLFTDNRHGKVISSPTDVASLADAIAYYCDQNNIIDAQNAINSDNIPTKVSTSRVAADLQNLYERIMQNNRRNP